MQFRMGVSTGDNKACTSLALNGRPRMYHCNSCMGHMTVPGFPHCKALAHTFVHSSYGMSLLIYWIDVRKVQV